jgi:hypothetical protein
MDQENKINNDLEIIKDDNQFIMNEINDYLKTISVFFIVISHANIILM